MKLYFFPDSCSLAPHIVLRELGLPFELSKVDNKTKTTADGDDFLTVNPKGQVAALRSDDGRVLTEGPAILQYLADLKPGSGLAPANGTWERVQLQEWLNFVGSEIHAGMMPLYNSAIPEDVKFIFRSKLFKRFDHVETALAEREYLLGAQFTIADAYLFTVMRWNKRFEIDLKRWPVIVAYMARVGARTSVLAALEAEAEAEAQRQTRV